jgi:multiple sugar transport system substrate-binding protein
MRKVLLFVVILSLLIVGAVTQTTEAATTVTFWTAPNPQQESYWKGVVDEWNASHPEIQIEWDVIPAGVSSEDVLLTSIATGTAPDISTNIFSGFAAQLVSSGAIVAFDEEFADFGEVVDGRKMRSILEKGWGYKGHYYVLPIYNNAMRYWWNKKILDEVGIKESPRTYSDVFALAEKATIPGERYGIMYPSYRNWWDRWFGYLTLYYAASQGAPYLDIENNKVLFNNEAGMAVLKFMDQTFRKGYATNEEPIDPLQKGQLAGKLMGPWDIIPAAEQYPDFEYVVTPPPVPDDFPKDAPIYTFADTKGMVLFTQSKNKKEAWEFIKWYFSDIKHDVAWLEATNMPPVREDITTNPVFNDYWASHPVVKKYAEGVPYSVPPALIDKTIEVQRIMGREMIEPIWFGTKEPEQAMADAVKAIEDYLSLSQ